MSILRAAVLIAVLAAAPSATFAAETGGVSVALTLADAVISRRPLLAEDAEASAAQSYFQYDALLTLGALALAGGALAAWGGRPRTRHAVPNGKDGSVRWMQANLANSVAHPRDAA